MFQTFSKSNFSSSSPWIPAFARTHRSNCKTHIVLVLLRHSKAVSVLFFRCNFSILNYFQELYETFIFHFEVCSFLAQGETCPSLFASPWRDPSQGVDVALILLSGENAILGNNGKNTMALSKTVVKMLFDLVTFASGLNGIVLMEQVRYASVWNWRR